MSSIFGGSQQQRPNLFGSLNTGAQQAQSPFGSSTQPQQTGFFGGSQQQQPQQTNLFGGSQQQLQQSGSVFGSNFGASTQQQQQPLGGSLQSSEARTPLWQPGSSLNPREKGPVEQMQVLYGKWNPESLNCAFQQYLYTYVGPERVPYFVPGPGEDEKKWEEALSKKPMDGVVPVLARGFPALGERLRVQAEAVKAMLIKLHEIYNSLNAVTQKHELEISVRAAEARRKHATLSQRALALATKVQVLRNRGYAMDSAEEELRTKLAQLERGVFDPQISGREEEIWARMVAVRERARQLQEESERIGKKMGEGQEFVLDDDAQKKAKKLLSDYDNQLSQLKKEIEQIKEDLEEWEGTRGGTTNGYSGR